MKKLILNQMPLKSRKHLKRNQLLLQEVPLLKVPTLYQRHLPKR